ncbi:class I SAM-dependent methyltransferase [Amycolatopsis rhizosphaerae]|uniref:Class I SAM-dependent methyltransferase n=1 Tax=Amycolatopsis rhizosphaerae TaxID=2053003 RepID=A0A558DKD8_9PSEU|nr:class I SAM-dependent methyltransferase [Amycolatopsis rhizosphaerae]TVT61476.1 class I SAM-dependent methyltransferase [Amycolatopsis rhizosphaerae]
MAPTTDELDRIRAEQTAVWNAVSEGWSRWSADFERAASAVSELLIRMGGVRPGHSVLDFGTGLGDPALTAADVTGPTGRVVGVDLSPAMIELARTRAAGRDGVEFVVGDADAAPGGQDVVLSRWALPLTGDPEATARALRAALVPGGVLAAAVWGRPPSVPMIALGFATVADHLALDPPPPGGPGPFALADPAVLRDTVAAAGFRDVEVTEHVVGFTLDSPDAFARFTLDVLPPRLRRLADSVPKGVRRALEEAAERRLTPAGEVDLTSVCRCVRAVA